MKSARAQIMAKGLEQAICTIIYIDKNPNNLDEGWGWVQIRFLDMKRFNISNVSPATRSVTKQREVELTKYKDGLAYVETYIETYTESIHIPLVGKGCEEQKFILSIKEELVPLRAQKSLTIEAVCSWIRSWAPAGTKVFPESRSISLDNKKPPHQSCFVYFLLNADSNAIKIGWAKDVNKRMRTFQTASPATLKLLKSVQVEGAVAAQVLERSLHQRFHANRLSGEWFKVEEELLKYINHL